jgi:hypothetical protein
MHNVETVETMLNDALIEKLGNYYSSEYVKLNLPYLREITFEAFLHRYLNGGGISYE